MNGRLAIINAALSALFVALFLKWGWGIIKTLLVAIILTWITVTFADKINKKSKKSKKE
jgi:membrane protein implicated in regulation of membrane protease activity